MNKKKSRFLIALIAVMLCMAAFSTVAYAAEGDETEPTETSGADQTAEDGNLTACDLQYDQSTNKQFITLETRNGKVFYLVIDYDKPVDEELEQYHAYFLNLVDERDLLDIIEEDDLPEETASVATTEPTVTPSPKPSAAIDEEPESQNSTGGIIAVVLIVAVIVGGVVYFIKFRKPKQTMRGKINPDEYDFDEDDDEPEGELDEPYEQEDEAETEDDEP